MPMRLGLLAVATLHPAVGLAVLALQAMIVPPPADWPLSTGWLQPLWRSLSIWISPGWSPTAWAITLDELPPVTSTLQPWSSRRRRAGPSLPVVPWLWRPTDRIVVDLSLRSTIPPKIGVTHAQG